jgi:hypothetical protein
MDHNSFDNFSNDHQVKGLGGTVTLHLTDGHLKVDMAHLYTQ